MSTLDVNPNYKLYQAFTLHMWGEPGNESSAKTKHSWQNGTRCRDGVNVLLCRSHLVWLVFEGSLSLHGIVLFGKLFVTLLL